jgi:Na+-translocating ferredoxin:NAD+ oxidoreductase RnfG subunit
MIKKLFSVICIVVVCMAFSVPEKIEKKADKIMAKFYETESFQKEFVSIPKELNLKTASEFGNENFFRITANGKLLGYGYIGNAPSKTATFDYLVLFDKELIVTKSKVLVYREEYGGEIGSKRWLQQFTGVSVGSKELRYNQEIIPISGATISVRSMTRAMNDLLKSISVLQQQNIL